MNEHDSGVGDTTPDRKFSLEVEDVSALAD
jgi:hypothetical protein